MSAPAPVQVSVWGELRGEQKLPGVLRVLVGGQHAGAIEHYERGHGADGEAGLPPAGNWVAQVHGLRRSKPGYHETAIEALRAVLRSSWARRLGARAASRITWSDRASRLVASAYRDGARIARAAGTRPGRAARVMSRGRAHPTGPRGGPASAA